MPIMQQPEYKHQKTSTSNKLGDKKPRLTLQDLHTVIEIHKGTYNFTATHSLIKRNYINTKIYAEGGEKYAFFQSAEAEIDFVIKIYNETKSQTHNDMAYDQIVVSDDNCLKLEALLIKYFQKPYANVNSLALIQLDGVMNNFNNIMEKHETNPTQIDRLLRLTVYNLLPLPAAEQYLLEQLNDVNNSHLLTDAIANSCTESALILLKHISSSAIFKEYPHIENNALELAIAKGRHHSDSNKRSSLTLGYIIDEIFAIIKKEDLSYDLLRNIKNKYWSPLELALGHGDIESTTHILELCGLNAAVERQKEKNTYQESSEMMCGYTTDKQDPYKQELESEDDTNYHYDTYSFLKEIEWKVRTEQCKALMNSYRQPRNPIIAP